MYRKAAIAIGIIGVAFTIAFFALPVVLNELNSIIPSICYIILLIIAILMILGSLIYIFWNLLKNISLVIWHYIQIVSRLRLVTIPSTKNTITTEPTNIISENEYLKEQVENLNRELEIKKSSIIKLIEQTETQMEFYRSRQSLTASRGPMSQELGNSQIQTVWVAWWSGISACQARLDDKANIQRRPPINLMILYNPYGKYLESHAQIEDKQPNDIKKEILATYNRFGNVGVDIRFFDGYIGSMIITDTIKHRIPTQNQLTKSSTIEKIANSFSNDAWIRHETCLPYKDTINPCNFVVYRKNKNDENLFKALINSFLFLLNKSKPYDLLQNTKTNNS